MIIKENGLKFAKLIHVSVDNGKTGNSNKVYLALFDVHVGKQKKIQKHDSSCYKLSKTVMNDEGYDSIFAKGGIDLRNNEFIVVLK